MTISPLPNPPLDLPLRLSIAAMREPVSRGETRPRSWRLEQLNRLSALLKEAGEAVLESLAADLGRPPVEAMMELITVQQELRHTRRHLRRWMTPRPVPLPFWGWPGGARIQREPLGCVLIIGPWNYPFQLCLRPLVSALAAGNSVVIKPSEQAPRTAELIERLVHRHFAPEVAQVVLGDGGTAARLLEERFDHILFTGGGRVGRLVLAAAARHLTPVTLELGGKSPAIVLEDADLAVSARRLAWAKGLNAGQTCIAPDHLLVVPAIREELVAQIRRELLAFYGTDPLESPDLARIVNRDRFQRLEALLAEAQRRNAVLVGGRSDPATLRIEPTLIEVAEPRTDPLMQEEIFGPLLPVVRVHNLEEALHLVRQGEKPLALYLFGGDNNARDRVLASTSSGSVVFNDAILQAAVPDLPFGGVGASGMGNYHGEAGFCTFSHQRSVMFRTAQPDLPVRYPPYAGKLGLIRRLLG